MSRFSAQAARLERVLILVVGVASSAAEEQAVGGLCPGSLLAANDPAVGWDLPGGDSKPAAAQGVSLLQLAKVGRKEEQDSQEGAEEEDRLLRSRAQAGQREEAAAEASASGRQHRRHQYRRQEEREGQEEDWRQEESIGKTKTEKNKNEKEGHGLEVARLKAWRRAERLAYLRRSQRAERSLRRAQVLSRAKGRKVHYAFRRILGEARAVGGGAVRNTKARRQKQQQRRNARQEQLHRRDRLRRGTGQQHQRQSRLVRQAGRRSAAAQGRKKAAGSSTATSRKGQKKQEEQEEEQQQEEQQDQKRRRKDQGTAADAAGKKKQGRKSEAARQAAALRLAGQFLSESYQQEYAAWKARRDAAARNLSSLMNGPDFEAFLEKLKEAKDTCSIRTLEAFEMLDQLKIHANALADEQEAQHAVLTTEGKALNATEDSITDAQRVLQAQVEVCEKERNEAAQRVQDYIVELKELTQIAEPEVRTAIAESELKKAEAAKVGQETPKKKAKKFKKAWSKKSVLLRLAEQLELPAVLLERGRRIEWTQVQCVAYVHWRAGHNRTVAATATTTVLAEIQGAGGDVRNVTQGEAPLAGGRSADPDVDPAELTCEQMKKNLQEEFEKSYLEVVKLREEAEEEEEDETCDITAHTMYDGEMVDLGPHREHATDKMEEATVAIAAVRPVYDLMMIQMKKMAEHVAILEEECKDNELVKKFIDELKKVIIETLRCPDMKKLVLDIPETPAPEDKVSKETAGD